MKKTFVLGTAVALVSSLSFTAPASAGGWEDIVALWGNVTAKAETLFTKGKTWAKMQTGTFGMCTGGPKGMYYAVSNVINDKMKAVSNDVKLEVIQTAGTPDNLSRLQEGQCPVMIGQSDVVGYTKAVAQGLDTIYALYPEPVHLICNVSSEVNSLQDLMNKHGTVAIGAAGSGAFMTWQVLGHMIPGQELYKSVRTTNDSGSAALLKVMDGNTDCLLKVISPYSKEMADIDAQSRGRIKLVELTHPAIDMNVYSQYDFSPKVYKNLTAGQKTRSIATQATVYVYKDVDAKVKDALSTAILNSLGDIEMMVAGKK